jgi:hypothetical protein
MGASWVDKATSTLQILDGIHQPSGEAKTQETEMFRTKVIGVTKETSRPWASDCYVLRLYQALRA